MYTTNVYKFDDPNAMKACNERQSVFMNRAFNLARKSHCFTHRHGCVIVKDDEIVSEGFNHTDVHLYHKLSIHAEVDAISKLKKNRKYLSQCDLYVVRIGRDSMGNPLKYSKPCPDCIKAIQKSGIRRVYYSSNNEFEKVMLKRYLDSSDSSSDSLLTS